MTSHPSAAVTRRPPLSSHDSRQHRTLPVHETGTARSRPCETPTPAPVPTGHSRTAALRESDWVSRLCGCCIWSLGGRSCHNPVGFRPIVLDNRMSVLVK
ncbi:unnamed protein product [Protopolystoma xenopodis]|uniref:Uncharacterized protein n=1 Tax=Protopolystoma xenopodis TaxID=117903 RepID=A0A448X7K5_9PLAT|nr:unnamed protein product [Protopolystoma xenopodis]